MAIKGVFFDLDGTLAHTAPDMLAALNRMRAERDMEPLRVGDVWQDISGGAALLLRKFIFESDEEVIATRPRYLKYYEETAYEETRLFDGMKDALDGIVAAGCLWGIVTNKPARYAEPVVARLGLDGETACLVCPDHCERGKPAPDPLLLAMEQTGCVAEECAYVGDDSRDLQAARAANMRFVAAGWGYWTEPQDGEIAVAATPSNMLEILFEALPGLVRETG